MLEADEDGARRRGPRRAAVPAWPCRSARPSRPGPCSPPSSRVTMRPGESGAAAVDLGQIPARPGRGRSSGTWAAPLHRREAAVDKRHARAAAPPGRTSPTWSIDGQLRRVRRARHCRPAPPAPARGPDRRTPADGLVMATRRRVARPAEVAVVSYDYTVLAGTQGIQNHRKTDRLFALAAAGAAAGGACSPRAAAGGPATPTPPRVASWTCRPSGLAASSTAGCRWSSHRLRLLLRRQCGARRGVATSSSRPRAAASGWAVRR